VPATVERDAILFSTYSSISLSIHPTRPGPIATRFGNLPAASNRSIWRREYDAAGCFQFVKEQKPWSLSFLRTRRLHAWLSRRYSVNVGDWRACSLTLLSHRRGAVIVALLARIARYSSSRPLPKTVCLSRVDRQQLRAPPRYYDYGANATSLTA